MRGHTPTMLLTTSTREGIDSSPVMTARRRLVRDIIQSRCSAPFGRVTMNSVMDKGSRTQRRRKTPSADSVRGDAGRKSGIPPACASTHFPSTPCKSLQPHATRQKSKQGTLNCQLPPQPTRAPLPCV